MPTLSPNEKLVFQSAIVQAKLSAGELARQVGLRESAVRAALEALHEKKVFLGKRPYLNPFALGMTEYLIYLSLTHCDGATRDSFLKALCEHERVSYVAEVGGDYQYDIRFSARDSRDLIEFTDGLSSRFSAKLQIPALAIVHAEEYSSTRHNFSGTFKVSPLGYSSGNASIHIDETDHRILSLLANEYVDSHREIARRLGLPPSTVNFRVRRMETLGLIIGYCYVCDTKQFGNLPLTLLVYADALAETARTKLIKYCRQHPQIAVVNITIGPWQARLLARVEQYQQAIEIIHEMYELFSGDVHSIRFLPQLRFHKYALYPFRNYESVMPRKSAMREREPSLA